MLSMFPCPPDAPRPSLPPSSPSCPSPSPSPVPSLSLTLPSLNPSLKDAPYGGICGCLQRYSCDVLGRQILLNVAHPAYCMRLRACMCCVHQSLCMHVVCDQYSQRRRVGLPGQVLDFSRAYNRHPHVRGMSNGVALPLVDITGRGFNKVYTMKRIYIDCHTELFAMQHT